MELGQVAVGIVGLAVAFAVGAISGALSVATTAFVIAAGAHLVGFVTLGTAQAIALWFGAGGALLGGIGAMLQLLLAGAMMG